MRSGSWLWLRDRDLGRDVGTVFLVSDCGWSSEVPGLCRHSDDPWGTVMAGKLFILGGIVTGPLLQ